MNSALGVEVVPVLERTQEKDLIEECLWRSIGRAGSCHE